MGPFADGFVAYWGTSGSVIAFTRQPVPFKGVTERLVSKLAAPWLRVRFSFQFEFKRRR